MCAAAVIDSLKLVQERGSLRGEVRLPDLPRLNDVLFDTRGSLNYVVSGNCDSRGRPELALSITGVVHLLCQRCLEVLDHTVSHETVLRLVAKEPAESEMDDDPEAPDWIEASKTLDLNELIEDELLLTLPVHPRHADACSGTKALQQAQQDRQSAFATLAKLKISGKGKKE